MKKVYIVRYSEGSVNCIFAVFIIVYPFFTFEDLDKIYSNIKVYPVIKKILNFLNKPI